MEKTEMSHEGLQKERTREEDENVQKGKKREGKRDF